MLMRNFALACAGLLLIATTACKKNESGCYNCTYTFYTASAGIKLDNGATSVRMDTTMCGLGTHDVAAYEEMVAARYKFSKGAEHMTYSSLCKEVTVK